MRKIVNMVGKSKYFAVVVLALMFLGMAFTLGKYTVNKEVGKIDLNVVAEVRDATLLIGTDFKNLLGTNEIDKLIFGTMQEYEDKMTTEGMPCDVDEKGKIKMYIEGSTAYVLSYGKIYANEYCANMFSDLSVSEFIFSNFDTSRVLTMYNMFNSCSAITTIDVSGFDTSNVQAMDGMFGSCSNLVTLDLSNFDTSNCRSYGYMFLYCTNLEELNVNGINTRNADNLGGMFRHCQKLTTLDLSSFDTSNCTNMQEMFYQCTNLKTIYVSNLWTTASVQYSSSKMFSNSTKLVGGNGTTYNSSQTTVAYACIDRPGQKGYLTEKTN